MGELKNYTPAGLEVRILWKDLGYHGRVRKIAPGGTNPSYLIDLADPLLFETHVRKLGIRGKEEKALYSQMSSDGCLKRGQVTCLWMPWESIELIPKAGLPAEHMEPSSVPEETCKGLVTRMKTWPGRIGDVDPGAVHLELFDPIPVEAAPAAVLADAVIGDFMAPESDQLVMLPLDPRKSDATHGLRILRPETADYYSQFDL